MLVSHHQNAGQNHDIKIANRSSENMAQFKYLGMIVNGKGKVVPVLNEGVWGSGCIDLQFLDLGTSWR
jgi:hypothetical protein